jgi:predicted MFS family arabinose efflux permease
MGTALIARLPGAMATLGILLLLGPAHGYALAGLACTIYVGASAVTNPLFARWVDRAGARRVVVPASIGNAIGLAVLATVPVSWLGVEYSAAALAGLSLPPITAVARGLWPRLMSAELLPVLFGLEATAQELVYITGPALLAVLAGAFGARTALLVTAAVGLSGTIAFVANPVFGRRDPADQHRPPARLLRSARLWAWLAVACSWVMAFGIIEVAVVAFVAPGRAGGSAASGLVLAVWSAGSMVGGVWFGRRAQHITDGSVLLAAALIAATCALPGLATTDWVLALLLFAGGFAIAPGLARLYIRISAAAPESAQTEVFGWLAVAFTIGNALGTAVGGVAANGLGPRPALALAAAPPVLGGLVAAFLLRRIPPPGAEPRGGVRSAQVSAAPGVVTEELARRPVEPAPVASRS